MTRNFDQTAGSELLGHIAVTANEAVNADVALRAAPRTICTATGWPVGCVCVCADSASGGRAVIGWYVSGELSGVDLEAFKHAADAQWRNGEGLPNRVVTNGAPAWSGELARSEPGFAEAAKRAGLVACYAFPVGELGDTVAVLVFYAREFLEPSWDLLPVMAKVATQLRLVVARDAERAKLRAAAAAPDAVFENAADACIAIDGDDRIVEWNEAATAMFGWSRAEAIGRLFTETVLPVQYRKDHEAALVRLSATAPSQPNRKPQMLSGIDRTGHEFPIELTLWCVQQDGARRYYAAIRDISDREVVHRQLERHAYSDSLTGLPNRAQLLKHLDELLQRRAAHDPPLAVMFVDLDGFKRINDGIGHDAGDEVLKAVAGRLRRAIRSEDMVARIGGDEFIIVCPDLSKPQDPAEMTQRIQASLADPIHVAGSSVPLTASVGWTMAEVGNTAQELIAAADAAMYDAKRSGGARFKRFDTRMRRASAARLQVENELREALDRNQLCLYYQPIVRAADGRVAALEALMRWRHPSRGLLPPGEFIPVAEASGQIVALGSWALREACRCAREWSRFGTDLPIRVSVNLSARQLGESDLIASVDRALTAADLDPRRMEFGLELTEAAALPDGEAAVETLRALRSLGVRLSIDDFGTGHTSLAYLKRLEVDTVKVDLSFVRQVAVNSVDRAIVDAVSTLSHALGIQVVAEGVENELQARTLRELKVDLLQGFLYGRPQPMEALVDMLSRRAQAGVV